MDAPGHMALDEAILELALPGTSFFRFYEWRGPAVTFGLAQPYALALACAKASGMACVPIVRRPTGGGVVFHDGDLTFSVVFPWERLSPALQVYERMHLGIREALAKRGVETSVAGFAGPPPLLAPPAGGGERSICFDAPSPFDLLGGNGEKLLGGALRRRKGQGLYQGSFRPERCRLPRRELEVAVAEGICAAWPGARPEPLDPAWFAAGERLAEKYGSAAWNKRR